MFDSLIARLKGRKKEESLERNDERAHMSPEERELTAESVDDRQAELNTEAHFGNADPDRFLDTGKPPQN